MHDVRRLLSTTALLLGLLALAAPAALAHDDDDHDHDDDVEYADPVIWDGTSTVDCRLTGEGTIRWELTGSDDVTVAELHIDQPVRSVTSRNAPPYVWISDLHPLDEMDADADRITGDLGADATLVATTCPAGGDDPSIAPLALAGGGGLVLGLAGGLLARRRGSTPDAA